MLRARWLLPLGLLLAACGPTQAIPSPTAAGPSPSPHPPTAAPTPTLAAQVGRPRVSRQADGGQVVRGIFSNQSDQAVAGLRLAVEVYGAQGNLLAAGTTGPLLPWLAPGAESPYQFPFTADDAAARAQARLVGYRPTDLQSALVTVEIERVLETVDGGARALGWLQPPRTGGAHIDRLALASYDGGALAEVSAQPTTVHSLSNGRLVPFEAIFNGLVELVGMEPYLAASAADPASDQIAIEVAPGLQFDARGNPFVTGTLINQGNSPAAAEAVLALRDRDGLLRVLSVGSPLPLTAGESRPFGVGQLALPSGTDPANLTLDGFVGAAQTELGDPVPISSAISSFEQIGGSVFLRGAVDNLNAVTVASPTLFAALRSTEGELWTAGSLQLAEAIKPGESIPFVINLPLPAEIELPAGEFDLRALGLATDSNP
jgi:hypothetical protein